MDNYQKVEQLVNKAGCSFEEAKAALEGCGWDMLDAVISLEREGKVKRKQQSLRNCWDYKLYYYRRYTSGLKNCRNHSIGNEKGICYVEI